VKSVAAKQTVTGEGGAPVYLTSRHDVFLNICEGIACGSRKRREDRCGLVHVFLD